MGASKLLGSKVSCIRLTIKTSFKAKALNSIWMQILIFKAIMSITFSRKWMRIKIKGHLRTTTRNHLLIRELMRSLHQTRKIMCLCRTLIIILRTMDLLKSIICNCNKIFRKTCRKFYKLWIRMYKIRIIFQID